MSEKTLAQRAGKAILWKASQLLSVKVIFLFRTLILAAILIPQDFGLFSIALISLDFISRISDIGLSQALIQKDIENDKQYDAIWTLSVLRGIIIFLFLFLSAPAIASLFNEPRAADLIRALSLKPLIEEFASVKAAELAKNLNFKSLALIRISEAGLNTITAILLVSLLGVWALILGMIAGSAAYLLLSYIFAPYKPKFCFEIKSIHSFITFGLWIFFSSLIAILAGTLIQVVISRELGTSALGLYYLSAKIGFLAVEISSEVIGSVAFPVYSRIQKSKEKISFTWKVIIKGILITYLPAASLIIILIPYLIEYVLGVKWEGTISLIRLLTAAGIFGITGDAVVPILKGTGRPDRAMIVGLIQYLILIAGTLVLINYFGIEGAAFSWILAGIGSLITNVYFLMKIKLRPFEGIAGFFIIVFSVSLLSILIAYSVIVFIPSKFGLVSAVSAAGVTYILTILFVNRKYSLGLFDLVNTIFPKINIPSLKNFLSNTSAKTII